MDRSAERVQTMKEILETAGVTNTSVFTGDFLKLDPNDEKFEKVTFQVSKIILSVSEAICEIEIQGEGFRSFTRWER